MGEIMRPLPFSMLMEHALGEYEKSRSIFGIREEKFFRGDGFPIGPAAGPNSQLAQNILASYLAGSRFVELKTVQTMDGDELRACVPRPCINAEDEGYNVEWSTELTVQQAFDEYVKAWFLMHVFRTEFGLGPGAVFNMSVGYSLEGIQSKKIDDYIEGLKDASGSSVFGECSGWLRKNLHRFSAFSGDDLDALSPHVSQSATLSTLHGCPREEIEKIAYHLLTEKQVHTYVKCNPTLLGYESARGILDSMGFDYVGFDDHHFLEDLQFDDAVAMLGRLAETAAARGLAFGVKITNTFPVEIRRGELPGDEMYMSGRALFPLSVTVAERLSNAFGGALPISYSGGADAFNLATLIRCGIAPITFATTILKPGGYERLRQLAQIAEGTERPADGKIDVAELRGVAGNLVRFERHTKGYREVGSRKTKRALALVDCAEAPCSRGGCPIEQQIPAYLEKVAEGDMVAAFEIIANDNVLPSVTGTICDHQCQSKCTRVDYEDSLQIRSAKKAAVMAAQTSFTETVKAVPITQSEKILVVGAGPAGLATAVYLRRNGFAVEVREKRGKAYGIVSHVIPSFRVSDDEMALDTDMAEAYGVRVEYGADPDYDLAQLRKEYDAVVLATGSWEQGRSDIPLDGIRAYDALDFLERSRSSGLKLALGERVAVVGGGDVAMDCARAAMRNEGVEEATIVYRRTRAFMPAQKEEIEFALADGVRIRELLAPLSYEGGVLTCEVMELGDVDASGRRGVSATGEKVRVDCDTVISAVGARTDTTGFSQGGLAMDERGFAACGEACETSMPGVYVAGDCKAGPATVVKAMADAKHIAADIMRKAGVTPDFRVFPERADRSGLLAKKGVLDAKSAGFENAPDDARRCLSCGSVCELCADVCPNRSNIAVDTGDAFGQRFQIIHLDALCNECGNCTAFCPSAGEPCKDKFTVFGTAEDFANSGNSGVLPLAGGGYRVRTAKGSEEEGLKEGMELPHEVRGLIDVLEKNYSYIMEGNRR
ncbi:MAG: putative selenate reductase subunit YgfK [Clostridiales Family XIII bacterium]|jgi:putative selenate reductase|nr:putative selenate reductase subunit YgfK [Clostridiales Family XIII bacterium]